MNDQAQPKAETEAAKPSCPYCSKPMLTPYTGKITDRGYDNYRKKQYVRTREMQFCSAPCAGNYQMGCEG